MTPENTPPKASMFGKLRKWFDPTSDLPPARTDLQIAKDAVPPTEHEEKIEAPKVKVIVDTPKKVSHAKSAKKSVVATIKKFTGKGMSTEHVLKSFKEGFNLVGKPSTTFTLHQKKHTMMIRPDCLFIDAQKYILSSIGGALGAEMQLDILEVVHTGGYFKIRAGAFGKDTTIEADEHELEKMLETLLSGRTYKVTDRIGQAVEIERSSY